MTTFPSEARLRGRNNILELLKQGRVRSFHSFLLRVRPVLVSDCVPVFTHQAITHQAITHQVIFIIPKRLIAFAHDRNLLRRRLRHAHREQRSHLPSVQVDSTPYLGSNTVPRVRHSTCLHIAYIYKHQQVHSFACLQKQVQDAMQWVTTHYISLTQKAEKHKL